jgi:hypothetical protein
VRTERFVLNNLSGLRELTEGVNIGERQARLPAETSNDVHNCILLTASLDFVLHLC